MKVLIGGLLALVVVFAGWHPGGAVAEGLEVRAGIDGRYRIGRWMPLHIRGAASEEFVEIATLDGDGVRIVQRAQVPETNDSSGGFRRYTQAGPIGAPLEVRSFAAEESEDAIGGVWRMRIGEGAVPILHPWVVAIGDPLGLDLIGRNELLGLSGSVAVSRPSDAAELPDEWFGYDGVEMVIVSGSGIDILAAMEADQQRALSEWVRGGGRLLLTLGASGPETLAAAPWIGELVGIEGEVELVNADPAAIEISVGARERIEPFLASRLSSDIGTVLLPGRTVRREPLPVVLHRQIGFGNVTVVAADLDAEPFDDWKQRDDFVQRVIPDLLPDRNQRGDVRPGGDVRYTEMAGQLRSALDRFPGAGNVQFSLVAAILLAAVGLIGPLDFFVVNRWLGRPLLGWLTFPLTVAAFSAAILLWRGGAPDRHVHQISVIDVDPSSGVGRGFAWGQVFTGRAERLDLDFVTDGSVSQLQGDETLSGPWGYAGEVFGGIEVAGEDIRLPPYALDLEIGDAAPVQSSLQSVPLAPLSSKGIAARWRFPAEMPTESKLRRRTGSDLLTGTFVNPLPVDVLEAVLVYRNIAFLLPTRVPAGSRIAAVETLQAKNFRWRLNRRHTAESSSRSEPWNPAGDQDLSRLMEIILFYGAAGGSSYTGLNNRTLADLDLSYALTSDRAILFGRLGDAEARLRIDGETLDPSQVQANTYIRVMLPVEVGSRNP